MRKLVSLLLTMAMALGMMALPGAAESADQEVVELDFFLNDTGLNGTDFEDEIAQCITKATGVKLNITKAKTTDSEQLNLLMASNDLPDLVCVQTGTPIRYALRDSGMVQDFAPLIDENCPEFWEQMGETYWDYWRAPDGKNYFYANCTFTEKTLTKYLGYGPWNATSLVRNDIYEALGRPAMDTPEAMIEVLLQVKEQYPDMVPFYTGNMTDFNMVSGCGGLGFWQRAFGVERYYEDESGNVVAAFKNPEYLTFLKWLNEMYQKGIITRESFTYTEDQLNAIRDGGQAFNYVNNATDLGRVPAGAPDTYYEAVPPFKTMKMTQQDNMSWLSTFISSNCKDPAAAIKFLQYISSEEGDRLTQWGIEGRDWEWGEDGNPRVTQEASQKRQADYDGYVKETGYRTYQYGINFADHELEYYTFTSDPVYKAAWDMYKDYCFAKLNFMTINPEGGSMEEIILQQIEDYFKQTFPQVVMCDTWEECETKFNEMVSAIEGMGLSQVEAVWTENSNRTKEIFGEENCVFYGMGMDK